MAIGFTTYGLASARAGSVYRSGKSRNLRMSKADIPVVENAPPAKVAKNARRFMEVLFTLSIAGSLRGDSSARTVGSPLRARGGGNSVSSCMALTAI